MGHEDIHTKSLVLFSLNLQSKCSYLVVAGAKGSADFEGTQIPSYFCLHT